MSRDKPIDLLLIGKTGNGKSATGNSILRKPKTFKVMPTTQSVTTETQSEVSNFRGRKIKVVDGPGVGDTRMSEEDALKLVHDRLQSAITANVEGYHAFLLVVRYGGRFTREDVQTIESLKKIFGMDFVKKFCIIVITCGDNLENDIEETGMDFNQWLQAQEGVFKTLLTKCGHRAVLFDNRTKDERKQVDQVARLVSLVDSLGGKRYTDEHFEKARLLREKQAIESKEQRIRQETLKETADFTRELRNIQRYVEADQIEDLKKLKTRAKHLYERLQDEDKKTGVLKYSIDIAHNSLIQVKSHLHNCEQIIRDQEEAKREQEKLRREAEAKLRWQRKQHERRMREERIERERQRKEEQEYFRRMQEEERIRRENEERRRFQQEMRRHEEMQEFYRFLHFMQIGSRHLADSSEDSSDSSESSWTDSSGSSSDF